MRALYKLSVCAAAFLVLFAGCNKSGENGKVAWKPAKSCAKSVSVYSGSILVEKYEFTLAANGSLSTLKRTDILSNKPLLNVNYTYEGNSKVQISGTFASDAKSNTMVVNSVKGGLEYSGPQTWTYHVALSGNGLPTSIGTAAKYDATNGVVSTDTKYEENFKTKDADIVEVTSGTVFKGDTKKATKTFSENAVTYQYTYSSAEDKQNFNAFLMECVFPVWYAAGLPGCKHLISDIKVKGDGIDYQNDQHIDYKFDEQGNITSAVRTWKSAGEDVLTLKYEFEY